MPPTETFASSETSPTSALPALVAAIACTLLVGLSVFPPSSTRLMAWPWAGYAAAGWLLPLLVALYRIVRARPESRFGGTLDAGAILFVLFATLSALTSPLRGVVLPHLLPVMGACALPFALLPVLQSENSQRTWRISGVILAVILMVSMWLWLEPWHGLTLPAARNEQPFGHANITGSVAVLASTWLITGALRERSRLGRTLFFSGALLAVITAISSGSRGAVIALAVAGATAGAIVLLRRRRFLMFIGFGALLVLAVAVSNAQLRTLLLQGQWSSAVRESNDQRTAMIVGGLRLGAERPLLGWGAGSIPHVFPRVRAGLPGTSDNFLQLHNTPAQLWATLGAAGILAILMIVGGLAQKLRFASWTPEFISLTAGLAAVPTILLFDHPFATPAFALLAAAHLAAWASFDRSHQTLTKRGPHYLRKPWLLGSLGLAGALMLITALSSTLRDLAARRAYSMALDYAANDDPVGYAAALSHADKIAPDDPYYAHLISAFLITGHPFAKPQATSPQAATALLTRTLTQNPDLEYAHYNLGWLLLETDPAASAQHFLQCAHLAPQRGSVYFGLGLARIQQNDTKGAVRAFAAEWLLNPSIAWSPVWSQPPLDALTPDIRTLAGSTADTYLPGRNPWEHLVTPAETVVAYRRQRIGYGVLMGHPDGAPPVDFNIQAGITLPPELRARVPALGWLPGQVLLDFISPR